MLNDLGVRSGPLVSVVLATRDRPSFLRIVLGCYRYQTYPWRELVVVDSGEARPVDAEAVAAAGGRVIRVEPGLPLGAKLNRGVREAQGRVCLKIDDDDWYAPDFVERLLAAIQDNRKVVCRPALAFLRPFVFFDLLRWELRRSAAFHMSGATMLFERDSWEERPFREIVNHEDGWFVRDQARLGVQLLPVEAPETYLAVRHRGGALDRGHTWARRWDGQPVEVALLEQPLYGQPPEALLPSWAVRAYRELRAESLGLAGRLPVDRPQTLPDSDARRASGPDPRGRTASSRLGLVGAHRECWVPATPRLGPTTAR
jgi:hypothetical protein